jgi:hypothetical protein
MEVSVVPRTESSDRSVAGSSKPQTTAHEAQSPNAHIASEKLDSTVGAPQGAPGDPESVYRTPFSDATGQADASLRAGLGCAHVNLGELVGPLHARCEAESRVMTMPSPQDNASGWMKLAENHFKRRR